MMPARKGPESRYPLHYLVWHNKYRELEKELSERQVGLIVCGLEHFALCRWCSAAVLAQERAWVAQGGGMSYGNGSGCENKRGVYMDMYRLLALSAIYFCP